MSESVAPRYVMYLLVRPQARPEDIAQAAIEGARAFATHPDTQAWLEGIFYKRVCRPSESDWQKAQACPDAKLVRDCVLVFRPRLQDDYPKFFRYFPLCRGRCDEDVGLGPLRLPSETEVSLILIASSALTAAVAVAHAAVALWKEFPDLDSPKVYMVSSEHLARLQSPEAKHMTESREGGKSVALAFSPRPWGQYAPAIRQIEPQLMTLE